MPTSVESAVNGLGQVAVMIPPQRAAPTHARVSGGRVDLSIPDDASPASFIVAREASQAAARDGRLLVVEAVGARVSRETLVRVLRAGDLR